MKYGAATAAEAIGGLEAANEACDVSALLRGFAGPEHWTDVAFLSMCRRSGSAVSLSLFKADAMLGADGSIEVLGMGDYTGPPGMSLAARFGISSAGTYSCTARLSRLPNFLGRCRFEIDGKALGSFAITPQPANYTFLVRLEPGEHGFEIQPVITTFRFYSLSVLLVPVLAPEL